jgi:hypothetical protein
VLRVEATSGKLRWRFPLGGRASGWPIVVDSQIFVATRAGQVFRLAAATGNPQRSVLLPQSLALPPVAGGEKLYLLAEHSTLFVLGQSELKCEQAIYVGHEAGSVRVSPTILPQHLVVAENRGLVSSRLTARRLDEQGLSRDSVAHLPLRGRIETPPVVLGAHLVVSTDDGTIALFEIPRETGKPLARAGGLDADASEPRIPFATVSAGQLWIAGAGLRQLAIPAGKDLQEQWSSLAESALEAPPQITAAGVFVVRREPNRPGILATMLPSRSAEPVWQTQLAAPLVALSPDASGQSITAVSSAGAVVAFDATSMPSTSVRDVSPPIDASSREHIVAAIPLDKGRFLLVPAGETRELLVIETIASSMQKIALPDSLVGPPIAWRGGIVAATRAGSVHWLDSHSGAPLAEPFQLPMKIGSRLSSAALAADGNDAFIISDGQLGLSRVGLRSEPLAHLAELSSAHLAAPSLGSLAILGKAVFLAERTGGTQMFILPDLQNGFDLPRSSGRVVFGPERVGDAVLLATDRGELLCYGGDGKRKWQMPLPGGELSGVVSAGQNSLILCTRDGVVSQIDVASGNELASADLKQPLTSAPVVVGNSVLVATMAGIVLKVTLPVSKGGDK